MNNIGKHIVEYYQGNKYLGSTTHDGEIPQAEVGYYGQRQMTEGEVRLKRVHKATAEKPLTTVRYNLQGR